MGRYTVVQAEGGSLYFGPSPKALEFSSDRAHLHAGIRDALAFSAEGQRCTVTLYDLPETARVPVIVGEVGFTNRGRKACDLDGDADWLMPFLRPRP